MKKIGVILIVSILIAISIFIIYCNPVSRYLEKNRENADNSNPLNIDKTDIGDNEADINIQNTNLENSETENINSNLSANTNPDTNNNTNLPSDLYTASCGIYYERYGICAGTCPEGTCSSEGRSCYCKKN